MTCDPAIHTGVRIRPCFGQTVSGDTAFSLALDGGLFLAIVDALGHGPGAYQIARAAEECLREHASPDVLDSLARLDERLRGTIGAVAGLGFVDSERGELRYVGIGNTTARRVGSSEERLVSRGGIVGRQMRTPQVRALRLRGGDLVLLHTDGVSERFGLDDYPGLCVDDPATIAGVVVTRFGKQYDDAACLALRYRP